MSKSWLQMARARAPLSYLHEILGRHTLCDAERSGVSRMSVISWVQRSVDEHVSGAMMRMIVDSV